jgi:hypothetical protein
MVAAGTASLPANEGFPSERRPSLAFMTARLISIRERLLDAADLVIDFATLGQYGLEPDVSQERAVRLPSTSARRSSP